MGSERDGDDDYWQDYAWYEEFCAMVRHHFSLRSPRRRANYSYVVYCSNMVALRYARTYMYYFDVRGFICCMVNDGPRLQKTSCKLLKRQA